MKSAAAEAVRLLSTAPSEENCRSFVLRRLGAVPEASPFHVGGVADWQIDISCGEGGGSTAVTITGHARPLPFFGALASAWEGRDDQGIVLRVQETGHLRPNWVEGTYGSWIGMWG